MYDIASSKYKQLCEIRKINNENLEMTEKEKEEKEWQPKGRRMMQLCLTDGVQDVTAIEYTPLKEITVWFVSLLYDLNRLLIQVIKLKNDNFYLSNVFFAGRVASWL